MILKHKIYVRYNNRICFYS